MPTEPSTIGFSDLDLAAPVLKAIDELGYEAPSPIQAKSIPPLLAGRDILGQAQTGTGKTAAFALPLLSRIELEKKEPQVLVLAPTRELAIQVAEAMQAYSRHLPGFHVLPIYGGQSYSVQLNQLRRGVHVVVATPGRLLDHLKRGTIKLDTLRAIVLDEADEMLRMGFIDDVETILEQTPPDRQVALFSATMPGPVKRVAHNHLNDPVEVKIASDTSTVSTIRQRYMQVAGHHKLDALTRVLEVENFDGMIIFVRTKTATMELAEKLEARGYASAALNGDMNQASREQTVERLKKGKLDILIATDVVARGLDVERISHVVNYDIPYDTESYVHRIGRTGRAGRTGDAILFVSHRERRMLRAIEKATRQPIEAMQPPSREAVADHRLAQFKQSILDTVTEQDLSFFEQMLDELAKESETEVSRLAAALVYLQQRERPLMPEQGPDPMQQKPRQDDERKKERRKDRERTPRRRDGEEVEMERFRLDVGREHGVEPKHIVGAIANEADIESRFIGQIKLMGTFSLVDLPTGMPKEMIQHLQKVRVCGRPLNITKDRGQGGGAGYKRKFGGEKRSGGPRNESRGERKPSKRRSKPE